MTYRKVLLFWFPLALAWLMMALEAPWIQGVISRKPDSETQLAAFGLVFTLSILIETPIIMLLATSNALARDRKSFQRLWRFMLAINCFIAVIAVLMAFTPLLDLYLGAVLNIPAHVIEATRPGMKIMICWERSSVIADFIRASSSASAIPATWAMAPPFACWSRAASPWDLAQSPYRRGADRRPGAGRLSAGRNYLYAYHFSADVRRLLDTPRRPGLPDLSYRQIMRFHIPLAITSLVSMLIYPAVERGLANTPNAVQSLAAWPVLLSIMFATRAGGMAFQEVVISLDDSEHNHRLLRNFTMRLGFSLSLIMLVFAYTPLIRLYVGGVLACLSICVN